MTSFLIGRRLLQLRKHLDLSQKKLADAVNSSSGYVSEIEQEKKIPGSEFLFLLRKEFNVNVNWLLTGDGQMFSNDGEMDADTPLPSGTPAIDFQDIQPIEGIVGPVDHKEFFELLKQANAYYEEARASNYHDRFRRGMRMVATHRQEVVKLLHRYYRASSHINTDTYSIRYSGLGDVPRDLPLITKENYLYRNNPELTLESSYSDKSIVETNVSRDEIIREIANWKAAKLTVWDDPIYTINKLEGSLKLSYRLTRFLHFRAAYGSSADELAVALATHGVEELMHEYETLLPKRNKHIGSIEQFLTFSNRLCVGGVISLFAARTPDNDVAIILQKRSQQVSDEPGSFTVIPRAFHQPSINPRTEVDLNATIYRECYEELFGGEETPHDRRHVSSQYFLTQSPPVAELYNGREGKNHVLQPLGVVWDLFKGNYACAYCMYVHDPSWWEKYEHNIRVNWEVDSKVEPVIRLSQISTLNNLIRRPEWAPEAYFTFIEGLRWLTENNSDLSAVKAILPELDTTPLRPVAI